MKTILRLSLLCLALILLDVRGAESMPDLSAMNSLKDVVSNVKNGKLVLRLEFEKPLGRYSDPIYYNKSVQIDFSQAYVRPAKRYFPTGDSDVTQVFAFQQTPNVLRLRLILPDESEKSTERFQLEKSGRFLTVSLNKSDPADLLDHFLSRASKEVVTETSAEQEAGQDAEQELVEEALPTVTRISTRNEGTRNIFTPAEVKTISASPTSEKVISSSHGTKSTAALPGMGKFGTRASKDDEPLSLMSTGMRMVVMLFLVLALIFIIFFLFKKFVLKNTLFGGGEKIIKVLSTGYLAPKKNIALVEVAGEILVLGISNDNISLLANIDDEHRIERIKNSQNKPGAGGSMFSTSDSTSRDSILAGAPRSIQGFAKYLKQFSGKEDSREQSVMAVTDQIRKNMGRIKTA